VVVVSAQACRQLAERANSWMLRTSSRVVWLLLEIRFRSLRKTSKREDRSTPT